MSNKLTIADYLRLARANPTVDKEFEYFKEHVFNRTLVWEGVKNPKAGDANRWTFWGIAYNHKKQMFKNFDDFKDTTYEEAAAIAYTKYYRAINAFILPLESRLMYFDTAYNLGNARAIKIMQGCARVPQDAIIGPVTREKMQYVTEECLYKARNTVYNTLVRVAIKLGNFLIKTFKT
jgi:lysozyme family protein